ncbi:MAG: glycosyltransferase family 9 protein [Planctomycetota bacterium]
MVDLPSLRRVYVRLPNWVGDVVLATPALRALRRAAPQAEVVAHAPGVALRLLEPEGLFDRALPLLKRGGPLWPLREGRRVRREVGPLDLAVLLPNSVSAALVAAAAGAPARLGYRLNGRGALLTHGPRVAVRGLLRPIPMVDYYLDLLAEIGVETSAEPRRPTLSVTPAARDAAESFLTRLRANAPSQRRWALNLGGSWETKRWVPQHAGRLVRLLRRAGITPILLRGPDEAELAEAVCAAAGERVPGADEVVGLGELCAVLERCELLITSDSGPRHFGVAAGIPVLVLIGSTHPGYTAVDYPPLDVVSERVDCWPCHLKTCPLDFRCMRALTAERVLAAAEAHLSRERVSGWAA